MENVENKKNGPKRLTVAQIIAMTLLGVVAIVGLLSEPAESLDAWQWLLAFAVTKCVGAGAAYLSYKVMENGVEIEP